MKKILGILIALLILQLTVNADMSAQRKNAKTLIMTNWLEKYVNNLH